jgi:hypothetical protein
MAKQAKSKTKVAKPAAKARPSVAPAMASVPDRGAPSPPKGFKMPAATKKKGGDQPTAQQVRDAGDVARELSAKTYLEDFGTRAPDAPSLCNALEFAKEWSDELAAAESWREYVRVQANAAWSVAMPLIKALEAEFPLAAKHDPSILKRYPQTNDFINVRKVAGQKAAVTRRKTAKKNAKAKSA